MNIFYLCEFVAPLLLFSVVSHCVLLRKRNHWSPVHWLLSDRGAFTFYLSSHHHHHIFVYSSMMHHMKEKDIHFTITPKLSFYLKPNWNYK